MPDPIPAERVARFDVARLGRARRTPQGFLQVEARLTRTGVLAYSRADGSTRRELRLPEEVFADRSLETLKGAPLTDRHDGGMVTPDNVRSLQIGHVGEDVRRDGDRYIAATLTIQDKDAIAAVLSGERREVSAGYNCKLQTATGTFDGEAYDAIQREIVYNHAGIGPRGWGRAGGEVSMKLDGGDAVSEAERLDAGMLGLFIQDQIELLGISTIELARASGIDEVKLFSIMQGFDNPNSGELEAIARRLEIDVDTLRKQIPEADRRDDSKDQETLPMSKITLHLDGADFEVEIADALASDLTRRFKAQTELLAAETARADGAEAGLSETKAKLDGVETELAEVKDPKHIQARIRARVALEESARKVLGEDEKLDGRSDLEVMVATLEKADPDFKVDGKDEKALSGLFEYLTSKATAPAKRTDGGRKDAQNAIRDGQTAETRTDSAKSREEFHKRSITAWEKPLGVSKDATA